FGVSEAKDRSLKELQRKFPQIEAHWTCYAEPGFVDVVRLPLQFEYGESRLRCISPPAFRVSCEPEGRPIASILIFRNIEYGDLIGIAWTRPYETKYFLYLSLRFIGECREMSVASGEDDLRLTRVDSSTIFLFAVQPDDERTTGIE